MARLVQGMALVIASSASVPAQRWLPREGPDPELGGTLYHEPGLGGLVWIDSPLARIETWKMVAGVWTYLDLPVAPPGRQQMAIAYDSGRGRAVLFGGRDNNGVRNDTWEFDGAAWVQLAPPNAPSPRAGHCMAYDPVRARVVAFGGSSGWLSNDETWEFVNGTWVQAVPLASPGPRSDAVMIHDTTLGKCLLVGGTDAQGTGNEPSESWVYDGVTWQLLPTTILPRHRPALMHDPVRGRSIVHGGGVPMTSMVLDDTWELVGGQWQQVSPSQRAPGGPTVHGTFDPLRGKVVTFGGRDASWAGASDVWQYDGVDWSMATPGRRFNRYSPLLAYDARRGCLVLHGGYDLAHVWQPQTLEWHGQHWQEVPSAVVPTQLGAMVYDAARGLVVAPAGAQTYEYDGVLWRAVATPHPVGQGAVGYDPVRGRVIVFEAAALRVYDGTDWLTEPGVTTPPPAFPELLMHPAHGLMLAARVGGSMAMFDGTQWTDAWPFQGTVPTMASDMRRGVVLSHGASTTRGLDLLVLRDTTWHAVPSDGRFFVNGPMVGDPWAGRVFSVNRTGQVFELDWGDAPAFGRLGRGCAGSHGTPLFEAQGAVAPRLGLPLPLTLRFLPPQPGLVGFVAGTRIDVFGSAPLPRSLAPLGLTGCHLWVAPEWSWLQSHGGDRLDFGLLLPADPALAGQLLAVQPMVFDPSAVNGIGVTGNAVVVTPW